MARLRLTEIDGKPVTWSLIDVDQPGVLADAVKQDRYVAWYVAPGIQDRIQDVVTASQQGQVPTLTGVVSNAERGLSVAVTEENGKPRIVVNLPSSKAKGCMFSSQLLKLARVIR